MAATAHHRPGSTAAPPPATDRELGPVPAAAVVVDLGSSSRRAS